MALQEGATGDVKKIVLLPREVVEQFDSLYPQHGAFTWFVREAITRFVGIHQEKPSELIQEAVTDLEL